ncbi:MAG: ComF family protein [Clostridia bacterium]|nr:ComF family protein [Clostridia bacterium]
MNIKNIVERALDLFFPPKCGMCGKIGDSYLCNKCTILQTQLQINKHEIVYDKYFNEILFIYEYKDIIRDVLINYKFNDKSYICRTFAQAMCDNDKVNEYIENFDYIVPVPLSRKRLTKRGYNQVELILRMYIKNKEKCNINGVYSLIKKREIKPQSTLNKNDRATNIMGAFSINRNSKYCYDTEKKILIVDDIYTTGSTINECARILREFGFESIGVLAIAKD